MKTIRFWLAAGAAAIALVFLSAIMLADRTPAAAETAAKPRVAQSDVPYMPPAASGWNGCGGDLHAGLVNADADFGSPVNVGVNGPKAGVGLYCDRAFDRFVIGLFVDYDWAFGDIKTVAGDTNDLTLGGRGGVLLTKDILAYMLVAWSRVDMSAGHINGVKVGGGFETRLPGSPFFVALEYQKATYSNVFGSAVDINADEVMLRLRYKFATGGR